MEVERRLPCSGDAYLIKGESEFESGWGERGDESHSDPSIHHL